MWRWRYIVHILLVGCKGVMTDACTYPTRIVNKSKSLISMHYKRISLCVDNQELRQTPLDLHYTLHTTHYRTHLQRRIGPRESPRIDIIEVIGFPQRKWKEQSFISSPRAKFGSAAQMEASFIPSIKGSSSAIGRHLRPQP